MTDSFTGPECFYNDKCPTWSSDSTLPGVCLSPSSACPPYHHLAAGLTINADYSHNRIQNTGSRVILCRGGEAVHLEDSLLIDTALLGDFDSNRPAGGDSLNFTNCLVETKRRKVFNSSTSTWYSTGFGIQNKESEIRWHQWHVQKISCKKK